MITLAVIIALFALILFSIAICVLAGGVTGLAIIIDIVIAVLTIGLITKIIIGK